MVGCDHFKFISFYCRPKWRLALRLPKSYFKVISSLAISDFATPIAVGRRRASPTHIKAHSWDVKQSLRNLSESFNRWISSGESLDSCKFLFTPACYTKRLLCTENIHFHQDFLNLLLTDLLVSKLIFFVPTYFKISI